MTWQVVLALTIGIYALRLLGMFGLGDRVTGRAARVVNLLPITVIVAVIALQTFTADRSLTVDTHAAGIAVAALCAWRRLPLLVTVLAAAGTTAALRALT